MPRTMSLIRQQRIGSGAQVEEFVLDRSVDSSFHGTGRKAKDIGTNDRWPEMVVGVYGSSCLIVSIFLVK